MYLNATTTVINTYKTLFDTYFASSGITFSSIWSKGGIFYLQKVNKHGTGRKGEKKCHTQWNLQDRKIVHTLVYGLNLTLRNFHSCTSPGVRPYIFKINFIASNFVPIKIFYLKNQQFSDKYIKGQEKDIYTLNWSSYKKIIFNNAVFFTHRFVCVHDVIFNEITIIQPWKESLNNGSHIT